MGKRAQETNETAPENNTQQVTKTVESEETKPTKYVVLRAGFRVSDREYDTPTDPVCTQEVDFWTGVANNHSYGEPVEAVMYDSKKHRVW
jgi:hypothetical protein